ncbi:IS30 family transposase [Pectinatus brassicae]|uniref:IS30 family transposase n=1 Tax=Pectinatus brassicae TaxID=862415 RepID=UPI0018C5CD09|nr:IS30 family transposase [Pectinatus brassicae]
MRPYHHFTLENRENLSELLKEGKSIRYIAKILDYAPSSVSREIIRNRNNNGKYHPWKATVDYIVRRKKCHRISRLLSEHKLYEWIVEKLKLFWSPETIAARWRIDHPADKLSFCTIYRALINSKVHPQIIKECSAKKHLRRHGTLKYHNRNSNTIKPEHLIDERPEEANYRSRLGDWEGDTIYGSIGKGLVVTCVDRKSRYTCAALLNSRNKVETKDALVKALHGKIVHTITLDNGSEFALFKEIEKTLHTTVYFAHPHAPWERGTNESTNGILRFFFPKGTNFHNVTQKELDDVLYLINSRPRKCLHWLSPIEFIKCCT